MEGERVYTRLSGRAVKGLQRLVRDREIYVRDEPTGGFTVVTKGGRPKTKHGLATKRKQDRIPA